MTVSVRNDAAASVHPPTLGLLGQAGVLGLLTAGVGLGPAGWLAGGAYAVAVWVLLTRAGSQPGVRGWGPADTVTLVRASLVAGVTALVAHVLATGTPGRGAAAVVLVALAAVALSLDAVDGQVARRTGTVSRFGARFDMETDSILVLVLCAYLAPVLGWWVLAIGAFRYAFGAAGQAWPWLRADLPPRLSRKVVAATQGIVLVVAAAGVLPRPATVAVVGLALASLCWSFGLDVRWLWLARSHPRSTTQLPGDWAVTSGAEPTCPAVAQPVGVPAVVAPQETYRQ